MKLLSKSSGNIVFRALNNQSSKFLDLFIMKFSYKNKLVTIKIKISEQYYTFLVDTGSEKSFLAPNKDLKNFQIELSNKILVKGVGKNKIIQHAYFIPEIKIDNEIISNTEFLIKDRNVMFYYLSIDGVLGWDILQRFDFAIDFKNKYFYIGSIQPPKSVASIPIISKKQAVILLDYNGDSYHTLLDLGANDSFISDDFRLSEKSVKRSMNFVLGINGFALNKISKVNHLIFTFSGEQLIVKNISIRSFNFQWKVKLGTDSLQGYTIYFINSKERIAISEKKTP